MNRPKSMQVYKDMDLKLGIKSSLPKAKSTLALLILLWLSNDKANQNDLNFSLYGTNSFNLVWEKVCAENFGSVLDKKLYELPLGLSEDYEAIKNEKLISIIDKPQWHKNNPYVTDGKVDTLKPDLIRCGIGAEGDDSSAYSRFTLRT